MTLAPPERLLQVRERLESGLYLTAWREAQALGPLPSWRGPRAQVLAGRLAMALGASRLGLALHLRARRSDPDDPEALYYHARAILGARGALAAFRFMRGIEPADSAPLEVRADWLAMRATIATSFRDFDAAEALLARAESLCPARPWIAVEHAAVLEQQDRLEEALARSLSALRHAPLYRPGIGSAARLLEQLGRPLQALALLDEADLALESAALSAHRALLLLEQERADEAEAALDRFEALSPLLDSAGRRWLAAQRSDAAYLRGDLESARARAQQAGSAFYEAIARRLALEGPADADARRLLPVPFVRQEHLTCSPASLASLTAYWRRPADPRALAREISYDGTAGHREREWARAQGWSVHEFRLTEDAARALVGAGVPFLLETQHATWAHAQVVAGIDTRRGTLLVRNPSWPRLTEMPLERLLSAQEAHGPRCLALLPPERAAELDTVALPDEADYDAYHCLQLRLLRHDRAGAQAVRDQLPAGEAHERMRLLMEVRLHDYDADLAGVLRAYESLLRRFPDDPLFLLRRIELLAELGRGRETLPLLEPLARKRSEDPVFALRLADAWAGDARRTADVLRLLERVLKRQPTNAAALTSLASLLWSGGRREEALELRRLAACSEIHGEAYVTAYMTAARHLDRADEALAFLRDRVERLGDRSSAPARSLFTSLEELGRVDEAFGVLEQALRRHREHGELLLFAAEAEARYGRSERARALCSESRGRAREAARRRTEARIHRWSGDPAGSLTSWRAVADAEPLAADAHAAIADLLSRLEGPEAARAHLERAAARAPTNAALARLRIEWLRDDPPRCETALRGLLSRHPHDLWAQCELALLLAEAARHEEAAAALAPALEMAPEDPATLGVRARLLAAAGRRTEALACFRAALERSIEAPAAIAGMVDAAEGRDAKLEALRFVAAQLTRQLAGDAYFTLQRRARGVLEPEEALSLLRSAREERPERWQAWSAEADELADQHRLDEAVRLLREAGARFPHVAALWLDKARVQALRNDDAAEIAALQSAAARAPGWIVPLRRLAEAHSRRGRFADALAALRRAAALDPADSGIAALTGQALHRNGEHESAVESLQRALRLEPLHEWAWSQLEEIADGETVIAFARALGAERSGDAEALLAAASRLPAEALEERLAFLDRALGLRPSHVHAHDLRAVALAEAGRTDEALAACEPAVFRGRLPREMLGRRAWVLAQSGRRREAIEAMRSVLDRHPDYWWGARALAEWTARDGSAEEARADAERLVRVAPESAEALRMLAEARLLGGDEEGARADLERALALDAADAAARTRLFELLLGRSALDEAEQLFERLRPHLEDQERICWRLRLLCGRRLAAAARELLLDELGRRRPAGARLAPALEAFVTAFGWNAFEAALACAAPEDAPAQEAWRSLARRPSA